MFDAELQSPRAVPRSLPPCRSKRDSLQTGLLAVILSLIMMKQGEIAEGECACRGLAARKDQLLT